VARIHHIKSAVLKGWNFQTGNHPAGS